ncbi:MAG: COX15/CtaA family protein [Bryobacterales bacterium]|nr:COX15/CtaA family protein [Bryobacterales bacterium]
MDPANGRLHAFSVFLAACTLFLVVAGASVTSKEAGLSVPDWPLSYGQVMPEMKGGVFYEHGHRMVATTVGFLTILLAIFIWRVDNRTWMKRLGLATLGGVIVQGVLGGMTVLFLLPKAVSISHACLAELFFSTTCAIALFTSDAWRRGADPVDSTSFLTRHPVVLPLTVLAQVALGAAFRHKALDLVWHAAGAAVATGVVLYAVISILLHYARHAALRGTALALLTITFAQVFLGVGAYMSRVATADAPQPMPVMVLFTVAHVAVGALTMAFSVLMTIQIRRHVRVAEAPVAQVSYAR